MMTHPITPPVRYDPTLVGAILLIMGAGEVAAIQWSWVAAIAVAILTACGVLALIIDDHVMQRNYRANMSLPVDLATANPEKPRSICTLRIVAATPTP